MICEEKIPLRFPLLCGFFHFFFRPSGPWLAAARRWVKQLELELELIQTQMAQKPMLRAEVYAHAMRASQNRKKEVRRKKEV